MLGFEIKQAIKDGLLAVNVDLAHAKQIRKVDRAALLGGGAMLMTEKEKGLQAWRATKLADPMNLEIWRTTNLQRGGYGSWFAAVPAETLAKVVKGKGPTTGPGGGSTPTQTHLLPLETADRTDGDYAALAAPETRNYGGRLPGKVQGLASYTAGHERRDLTFTPGGGPIVSHHEGNSPNQYDRYVFEIKGDDLNLEKKGGFSTFTAVKWQHPGCAGGDYNKASVALNMTGDTGPGWGLAAFQTRPASMGSQPPAAASGPVTGPGANDPSPPPSRDPGPISLGVRAVSVLAYLSQEKYGPLFSGHPTADKHRYPGVNKDGEALNAGHLHTDTYISNGTIKYDGPWAFRAVDWPKPGDSIFPVKCYIEWDPDAQYTSVCGRQLKGKWVVWTRVPKLTVKPIYPVPVVPPPYDPTDQPPTDINPVEQEMPSRYGKPKEKEPEPEKPSGPITGEKASRKQAIKGQNSSADEAGASGESALIELTGRTLKQLMLAPRSFHAFAVAKIATTPDWTKEVPYAYDYNVASIWVPGATMDRPRIYQPGSADGGEVFAPPEITARYADLASDGAVAHSSTFFGLWKNTELHFGYLSDDRSVAYISGGKLSRGTTPGGQDGSLVMRFYDSTGLEDTDHALVVQGALLLAPTSLPPSGEDGEMRFDNGDNVFKWWDSANGQWSAFGSGSINGGANVGTGVGVFYGVSGDTLQFKSLSSVSFPEGFTLGFSDDGVGTISPALTVDWPIKAPDTVDIAYSFDGGTYVGSNVAGMAFDQDLQEGPKLIDILGAAQLQVTTSGIVINGKLTVGGLIDPTGLELTPVAANPGGTAANTLWLDSGAGNRLKVGSNTLAYSSELPSISGLLVAANNLSDVASASGSLYNLINGAGAISTFSLTSALGAVLPGSGLAATRGYATVQRVYNLINSLTAETAPATDDKVAVYDASASATDGMTLESLFKIVNGFTEDTSPDNAADFVLTYDASAALPKKVALSRLGVQVLRCMAQADQTVSSTTMANATNMSLTVVAGAWYQFEACLKIDSTSAGGFKFDLDGGTCTVTSMSYCTEIATTTGTAGSNVIALATTALATDVSPIPGATTLADSMVWISGYVRINAGGTFVLRFSRTQASGSAVLNTGSWMRLTPIA